MNENIYNEIELSENDLFDLIYQKDLILSYIRVSSDVTDKFNHSKKINFDSFEYLRKPEDKKLTQAEFDKINQKQWFIPDNYYPNLSNDLYEMCKTQEQIERVNLELELYHKHGMIDLLYYLKYLVDTMREKSILWGVGRGSSVSSYVLFLLGVHKIDSIKYNLDIREFFKEGDVNAKSI